MANPTSSSLGVNDYVQSLKEMTMSWSHNLKPSVPLKHKK